MEKRFEPQKVEEKLYELWEKASCFTPKIDPKKKPFTIILPLPNASDPLHLGNALFTVEDIMIRYHRMKGEPTLWLPGADHGGIETQFVFEKKLAKEGKSRFDYDRQTLYKMIWDFVEENRKTNKYQMKRLGFSLDWSRYHYSLEPEIVAEVLKTFRKMHSDDLIYRAGRIVNFCPHCGTAFSDLEVDHIEREDFLYYLDYGGVEIATTRPETIFADVAVAVNPKDERFKAKVGQSATVPLIDLEVPIIADELVEKDFGTGALKITPGCDATDFEIGCQHHLETISLVSREGWLEFSHPRFNKLSAKAKEVIAQLSGLRVNAAREKTLELLERSGKLLKKEPLTHTVGVCYRCKATIEPMVSPQWFVKTATLARAASEAVMRGRTKLFPKKRFEKMYFDWMENIRDWNISRQVVWGPTIPAWYCLECNPKLFITFISARGEKVAGFYETFKEKYSSEEIRRGLQMVQAPIEATYQLKEGKCQKCGDETLPETDTFDTWFLSAHWPLTALGYKHDGLSSEDFKYFYPTSVMDTLWDILFFWVARMMMVGLYLTEEVPFRTVHLHARVVDKYGKKMSKSKGNTMDPLELTEKYGTDALRLGLILGVAPGGDVYLSEEKIVGYRNFCNKMWNAARFVLTNLECKTQNAKPKTTAQNAKLGQDDKKILEELGELVKTVTGAIEKYRFSDAGMGIYEWFWHRFCDFYLEAIKPRLRSEDEKDKAAALDTGLEVLTTCLKLLHPFAPYVTEEVWQRIREQGPSLVDADILAVSNWPTIVPGTN